MKPSAIDAVQMTQDSLPTVAATAPIENNTRGGTPLATQNAPVQSMPRSRVLGLSPAWPPARPSAVAAGALCVLVTVFSPVGPSEVLAQRFGYLKDIPHDA